jgi:hypothetical protein
MNSENRPQNVDTRQRDESRKPTPLRQVRDLLLSADARRSVQALSPLILNRMVSSLGLEDARQLLALCKTEQVRDLFDLNIWQEDRIDVGDLSDWLGVLLSLPDGIREAHLRGLDVELLAFMLRNHSRIYLAEDEIPPESEGDFYRTPDNWFVLDIIGTSEVGFDRIRALIDALYVDDNEEARRLIQNVMWELPSQLEEASYRWRSGRLEDLGFADPMEALALYTPIDPESVRPDEKTLDRPLASDPEPSGQTKLKEILPGEGDSLWRRASALLEGDEERRISQALLSLSNRALVADQVSPSDTELAEETLDRLHWQLNLGLQYLSEDSEGRALEILKNVALLRVARVGHTLVRQLGTPLRPLRRAGSLGREPGSLDLIDAKTSSQISALLCQRPVFVDDATGASRPIRNLEEKAWLSELVQETLLSQRLCPKETMVKPLGRHHSFGNSFRTDLINTTLSRSGSIDAAALRLFMKTMMVENGFQDDVAFHAKKLAAERLEAVLDPRAEKVVNRWLLELGESLAPLDPTTLDPRFIDCLIFRE